jgi:CSLREA domain-containing protein
VVLALADKGRTVKNKGLVARYSVCLVLVTASALLTRMALVVPTSFAANPTTIFTVNSPADVADANPGDGRCETAPNNNVCTLRAAIMEANHTPGGATINFSAAGVGTYTLGISPTGMDDETTGDLNITNSIAIIGNGAANTIINGNQIDRVFFITQCIDNDYDPMMMKCTKGNVIVSMSDVTIKNGKRSYTGSTANAFGGGIFSSGDLTLTNVVIDHNSANASTGAGYGGGINSGGPLKLINSAITNNIASTQSGFAAGGGVLTGGNATFTNSAVSGNQATTAGTNAASAFGGGIAGGSMLTNSTVSGNTAGSGGGIYGSGTLINSTVSGNSANVDGGGIYTGGTMSLYNVTIASNTANADASGSGVGAGIANASGTVNFQNTILARNFNVIVVGGHPSLTDGECSGTINSQGYNIMYDIPPECTVNGGGVTIADPVLGDLADNGGPTKTRAVLQGSPTIDAGNPGGCTDNLGAILTTDQRGAPRPIDGNGDNSAICDIGAFEFGSTAPTPTPTPTPTHSLGNISTRGVVGIGDQVMIGGFTITGTANKTVLLRAIGPSLSNPPINLSGTLQDPTLSLFNASLQPIKFNDNWAQADNASSIPTNLQPSNALESAILISLAPGAYTAIVSGLNGGTGIGLVEVFDLDATLPSKLYNISTRGLVETGDGVLIGGFIVKGQESETVVVRAIGPSLGAPPINLTNVLQNPSLGLFNDQGMRIQFNDDWQTDQQAEIIATGLQPSNPAESAIVRSLAPGNYTAIVQGVNGTTGIALVEVYGLN